MNEEPEADLHFLRHTLATLAYRGGKVIRDAPAGFAGFRVGESSRTAVEILSHIGDLLDWALALAGGRHVKGENYFKAEIQAGRLGLEQMPPRRELD